MAVAGQTLTFRDSSGRLARMRYNVNAATAALQFTASAAIKTAILPLTNCAFQSSRGPVTDPPTEVVYGTNADFPSAEDKAVFTFQTAAGAIHRFQVPAPKAAIFQADGQTVDPTNTDVVAFVAAIIANATNTNGAAIAFGGFGVRARRKLQRKQTIFWLNPAETGPDE